MSVRKPSLLQQRLPLRTPSLWSSGPPHLWEGPIQHSCRPTIALTTQRASRCLDTAWPRTDSPNRQSRSVCRIELVRVTQHLSASGPMRRRIKRVQTLAGMLGYGRERALGSQHNMLGTPTEHTSLSELLRPPSGSLWEPTKSAPVPPSEATDKELTARSQGCHG